MTTIRLEITGNLPRHTGKVLLARKEPLLGRSYSWKLSHATEIFMRLATAG